MKVAQAPIDVDVLLLNTSTGRLLIVRVGLLDPATLGLLERLLRPL